VRAVTNQNGDVIARHDFLPFGEEYPGPQPTARERKLFTGKERDAETGFDYFGARYYDARIGRFTTIDPLQTTAENLVDPQKWNRHAYVRNNPLRWVDPDGRTASEPQDDRTRVGPPPPPTISPSRPVPGPSSDVPRIGPAPSAQNQTPAEATSAGLAKGTWFVGVDASVIGFTGAKLAVGLFWSPGYKPGAYVSAGPGAGIEIGAGVTIGAIDGGKSVFEGPMAEFSGGAAAMSISAYFNSQGGLKGFSLNLPLLPIPLPVVSGAVTNTVAWAPRR